MVFLRISASSGMSSEDWIMTQIFSKLHCNSLLTIETQRAIYLVSSSLAKVEDLIQEFLKVDNKEHVKLEPISINDSDLPEEALSKMNNYVKGLDHLVTQGTIVHTEDILSQLSELKK